MKKMKPFILKSFAVSLVALALPAWSQVIQIGSLVSGQVVEVAVKNGQTVAVGQLLMRIDDARYQAKLKSAQADAELSRLTLEDAKIELAQALDLFDRTVSAKRELDAAQLKHDVAVQALKKAQAELQAMQAWARYYVIKSPVAAKVKAIQAPLGSTVFNENSPLIQLEN